MDTITFTILPDGTIKTETDKISMPNHANAEAFIRQVALMAGGKTTRTRKANATTTTHHAQHAEQKG